MAKKPSDPETKVKKKSKKALTAEKATKKAGKKSAKAATPAKEEIKPGPAAVAAKKAPVKTALPSKKTVTAKQVTAKKAATKGGRRKGKDAPCGCNGANVGTLIVGEDGRLKIVFEDGQGGSREVYLETVGDDGTRTLIEGLTRLCLTFNLNPDGKRLRDRDQSAALKRTVSRLRSFLDAYAIGSTDADCSTCCQQSNS